MKIKHLIVLAALNQIIFMYAAAQTDLEKPKPELATQSRPAAPIIHVPFYKAERELFGYNPYYVPNQVTFDPDNRPFIRTVSSLMTLKDDGIWEKTSFNAAAISLAPSNRNATVQQGVEVDERVVFDADGDAYMVARILLSNEGRQSVLLHSRDRGKTWTAYRLPDGELRMEFNDVNNLKKYPPAVLSNAKEHLRLILPTKKEDGTLQIPDPVTLSDISLLAPPHSGAGNAVISVGELVHTVFPVTQGPPGSSGTSQCVVTFDRASGKVTQPIFLGSAATERPDGHCAPAIAVTSNGTLHVVLGAHDQKLQYTTSIRPNDSSQWTPPVPIGSTGFDAASVYAYVALVCDRKDTLHVVTRQWNSKAMNPLVYFRKPKGGDWTEPQPLIIPAHLSYSIYYHRLNLDRNDRLFVSYWYYADNLLPEEYQAYVAKWPDEPLKPQGKIGPRTMYSIRKHDPAILFSADGGNSWTLALTGDFLAGIKKSEQK